MNETIITTTKRSSLSSRASKIPQKIQSSFFSLKPSASTLINEKLSTRISHMLFRPKSQLNHHHNESNISIVEEQEVMSKSQRDSSIILPDYNESNVTTTPYSPKETIPHHNIPVLNHDSSLSFSSSLSSNMTIEQYTQSLYQKCAVTIDDSQSILSHTRTLINACSDPTCIQQIEILNQRLNVIQEALSPLNYEDFVNEIKCIGDACLILAQDIPRLCKADIDGFTKELPKVDTINYKEYKLDQLDLDSCTWFRNYFVGKPYYTFIGPLNQPSPLPLMEASTSTGPKRRNHSFLNNSSLNIQDHIGIISVIEERITESTNQYRIIIRNKQTFLSRYIVHESMVKETMAQLELKGESFKLEYARQGKAFIKSANTTMYRAAILSVCPDADVRSYKELSAESTILAGLEKGLLKYDEIHIPKHYKFGLLTIKDNQTTEEAWFSNTDISDDLKDFLNLMGKQIKLKGYKGYSAGLDIKSGESGEYAYVSKWNRFDIVFHVAPLMPLQKNDRQQILRKKHVGNDIVCIIFLEGNEIFNPKAIRSQFLHVYIIIRPEIINSVRCWRIEVLRKSNVSEFGPSLPSPPIFYNNDTLKQFITLKLMNAENAALKSEKFSIPNKKARLGLFTTHIQTGLSFHVSPSRSQSSTGRNESPASMKHLKLEEKDLITRPKSIHVHKACATSRLLREALLDEQKHNNKDHVPPIPYLSRSTMLLHDFKNGIVSSSKKMISVGGKVTQVKVSTTDGSKTIISLKQENPEKPWRTNSVIVDANTSMKTKSAKIVSTTLVSQNPVPSHSSDIVVSKSKENKKHHARNTSSTGRHRFPGEQVTIPETSRLKTSTSRSTLNRSNSSDVSLDRLPTPTNSKSFLDQSFKFEKSNSITSLSLKSEKSTSNLSRSNTLLNRATTPTKNVSLSKSTSRHRKSNIPTSTRPSRSSRLEATKPSFIHVPTKSSSFCQQTS